MWIPDNGTKKYISYDGPLPSSLYRYRSVSPKNIERLIDFEIAEEAIFLAGLKDLNDPDEGRFTINFGEDYNEILKYWQRAIARTHPELPFLDVFMQAKSNADQLVATDYLVPDGTIAYTRDVLEQLVRVACFTTQPTNYSMWANYAKQFDENGSALDHGGICIEYQCDEGWRSTTLHPVAYADLVPEISVTKEYESELVRAMYSKAREWRCENEWRITSIIDARPPFPANLTGNSQMKIAGAVQSVIFGLKATDSMMNMFISRLKPVRPNLLFKRVVRDARTFERKLALL